MYNNIFSIFKGDKVIWIILLFLTLFSLLIVYSATGSLAYRQMDGNTFFYFMKQLFFLVLGFVVMASVVNYLPVKYMSMFSPALVILSIFLLAAAFVLRVGSGRTLSLGFISFQPAELAKISLVLLVSRLLANNQDNENPPDISTFWKIIMASGAVCGIISLVNFSTAALLFGTIMVLMFIGRIPVKFLLGTIGAGFLVVLIMFFTAPYVNIGRLNTMHGRIERFFKGDPASKEGITQADYAIMAIYRGGGLGEGPGGNQISNFMAAAYNDFIFAILIEEYGWFAFFVILLYIIFAVRAGIIVRQCSRTFSAFLVIGMSTMLVFQAIINMCVSVGLFPVTGQTLPWISMGGTSTLFTAFSFGAILRVSYQNKLEVQNENTEGRSEEIDEDDVPDEDHVLAEVGSIN